MLLRRNNVSKAILRRINIKKKKIFFLFSTNDFLTRLKTTKFGYCTIKESRKKKKKSRQKLSK